MIQVLRLQILVQLNGKLLCMQKFSPIYSDRIKTIGVPSLIHIWVQLLISP
jgi:hypothetical protein